MFGVEINDVAVVQQSKALEAALSTNPETQKALRKLINRVIKEAREQAIKNVKFDNGDPRGAAHSIRRTVYKKILGANLNIYNSRKAGKPTSYEPPRKLQPHQRGGNRVSRGERTNKIMHYGPHDRGFILRFLNSGTTDRTAGTRGGNLGGNRGSITARNFFRNASEKELIQAADTLANLIDTELETIMNKKK